MGIETPESILIKSETGKQLETFNEEKGFGSEVRRTLFAKDHIQIPYEGCLGFLNPGSDFDFEAERARLKKTLDNCAKEAASLAARLANPAFTAKAKPEAVDKARADLAHHAAEAERLAAALARLG